MIFSLFSGTHLYTHMCPGIDLTDEAAVKQLLSSGTPEEVQAKVEKAVNNLFGSDPAMKSVRHALCHGNKGLLQVAAATTAAAIVVDMSCGVVWR